MTSGLRRSLARAALKIGGYGLLLLLSACGADDEVTIDYQLRPILDRYLMLAPDEGQLDELADLRVGNPGLGPTGNALSGRCYRDYDTVVGRKVPGSQRRHVVVAPPHDGDVGGACWRAVVYHELAHCLHDLGHVDDEKALMYPFVKCSDERWSDYWASVDLDNKLMESFYQ